MHGVLIWARGARIEWRSWVMRRAQDYAARAKLAGRPVRGPAAGGPRRLLRPAPGSAWTRAAAGSRPPFAAAAGAGLDRSKRPQGSPRPRGGLPWGEGPWPDAWAHITDMGPVGRDGSTGCTGSL